MKKVLPIILLAVFFMGCGQKTPNLPAVKVSGKYYPANGSLIYQIKDENGKEQGQETINFQTEDGILCLHSDVKVTTVCLNKDTFNPVSEIAHFMVNKVSSDVKITFLADTILVTIKRNGKTKSFHLNKEETLYPDDALNFVLQGMDFSQKEGYLYDYFPYTSLKYVCVIKNLGEETIRLDNKKTDVYHIVVDFGKKKRDLYFRTKPPHLLIKRDEQNTIFVLKEFKP